MARQKWDRSRVTTTCCRRCLATHPLGSHYKAALTGGDGAAEVGLVQCELLALVRCGVEGLLRTLHPRRKPAGRGACTALHSSWDQAGREDSCMQELGRALHPCRTAVCRPLSKGGPVSRKQQWGSKHVPPVDCVGRVWPAPPVAGRCVGQPPHPLTNACADSNAGACPSSAAAAAAASGGLAGGPHLAHT